MTATLPSLVFVAALCAVLAVLVLRREPEALRRALGKAVVKAGVLVPALALALLAANFAKLLIPVDLVSRWGGEASGLTGILIASVAGAILPGGPFVAFPIAVSLYETGAGLPQMVSLITAWCVIALHRILTFELPLLGARFVLLRIASSLVLAPITGLLAWAVTALV